MTDYVMVHKALIDKLRDELENGEPTDWHSSGRDVVRYADETSPEPDSAPPCQGCAWEQSHRVSCCTHPRNESGKMDVEHCPILEPESAEPVDDIAASGRDWLPLHPRPPAPKPVSASGLVYQLRILADYFYESEDGGEKCELIARAAQELEELKRKELPNEHGKNRYGVDMAYFRKTINRELNRPLIDFRPDELARVFARLSVTADSSVIFEDEFQRRKTPEPESADHIPDAGKMVVSAEPVEMPYLLRKGGMWYAHNSSGYTARAELAELYTKEYAESYANNHDEVSAVPLNEIIKSADQLNPYIERIKAMHDALEYATKPSPPE